MGELSDTFETVTGIRQGDSLFSILFNCGSQKIIREWINNLKQLNVFDSVKFSTKHKLLLPIHLAFTDDLVILFMPPELFKFWDFPWLFSHNL